jgi:hypothetical protein
MYVYILKSKVVSLPSTANPKIQISVFMSPPTKVKILSSYSPRQRGKEHRLN